MDVRQRAVNYLNIKPRTAAEIRKYLKTKGYDEEEINEAVSELEEYHYIDDLQYCSMYFRYGFEKGRGTDRIKHELKGKGVDAEIIEAAYEDLEDVPDQLEMAMEICRNAIDGVDVEELEYQERSKLKAKLGRRLMSKGYSSDVTYKAINRILR